MHQINTILIDGPKTHTLGLLEYQTIPTKGDWIELQNEIPSQIYEVIQLVHAVPPKLKYLDIYLKHLGPTAQIQIHLFHQNAPTDTSPETQPNPENP
jgi:hypothetical protein